MNDLGLLAALCDPTRATLTGAEAVAEAGYTVPATGINPAFTHPGQYALRGRVRVTRQPAIRAPRRHSDSVSPLY